MAYRLAGGCHCGNIRADVVLSRPPSDFVPRACDCDFCCKHGAAYVSDPEGELTLRLREPGAVRRYAQGSGTADMLLCGRCGVMVAGLLCESGRNFAAINVRIIDGESPFGASRSASPKLLPVEDKVDRWKRLWFADVRIVEDGA